MSKEALTRYIRIGIITSLIISYSLLITKLTTDNDVNGSNISIFHLWIAGGVLYVLATAFAIKTNSKPWITTTTVITGTVWIFPPLIFTYFGIPFLIAYPIVVAIMIFPR